MLRDFLIDAITSIEPFKTIPYLAIKKHNGDVLASAQEQKGGVVVKIQSKVDIEELDDGVAALFGNLPYLKSLLDNDYTKEKCNIDIHHRNSSDNQSSVIGSLSVSSGRFKAEYQATDPFIGNLSKVKVPIVREWPIAFSMSKDIYTDFKSISRIHAMSPKIGGDRDDIFTISTENDSINITFGERNHKTSMVLCECDKNDVGEFSALFSISMLDSLFKLGDKGKIHLTTQAIKLEVESELAKYTYIISAKKVK